MPHSAADHRDVQVGLGYGHSTCGRVAPNCRARVRREHSQSDRRLGSRADLGNMTNKSNFHFALHTTMTSRGPPSPAPFASRGRMPLPVGTIQSISYWRPRALKMQAAHLPPAQVSGTSVQHPSPGDDLHHCATRACFDVRLPVSVRLAFLARRRRAGTRRGYMRYLCLYASCTGCGGHTPCIE